MLLRKIRPISIRIRLVPIITMYSFYTVLKSPLGSYFSYPNLLRYIRIDIIRNTFTTIESPITIPILIDQSSPIDCVSASTFNVSTAAICRQIRMMKYLSK